MPLVYTTAATSLVIARDELPICSLFQSSTLLIEGGEHSTIVGPHPCCKSFLILIDLDVNEVSIMITEKVKLTFQAHEDPLQHEHLTAMYS